MHSHLEQNEQPDGGQSPAGSAGPSPRSTHGDTAHDARRHERVSERCFEARRLERVFARCFDAGRLERVFARCFEARFRTRLEGRGAEPLYIPSPDPASQPHRIVYRDDYFASALHEVAHWCLAGAARRELDDYGYWYDPDGRSPEQQRRFEAVEARPQALEWIFSEACGADFVLSADNLAGGAGPSPDFAAAVEQQKKELERAGLPPRAERFRRELEAEWAGGV